MKKRFLKIESWAHFNSPSMKFVFCIAVDSIFMYSGETRKAMDGTIIYETWVHYINSDGNRDYKKLYCSIEDFEHILNGGNPFPARTENNELVYSLHFVAL